jgi:hypothetical protein
MTPSLHLIGKGPCLTILTGKVYNPPLAASPKANNSNFHREENLLQMVLWKMVHFALF